MYNLQKVGYNTSMQNQFTVEIKNFHYGFLAEGVEREGAIKREDVETTTSDLLQGIVFEPAPCGTYNLVVAVYEMDLKGKDLKKELARMKAYMKKKHGKELNCRVPVQYKYCGMVNRG